MILSATENGTSAQEIYEPGRSPTVAAVIITRNRVPLLRQTLNSLKDSTYPLAEIVVTDDSSSDETERMLASEFPGVIHVRGPQRGISANRNHGIRVATSEYILLSDDDMLVDPRFIELAVIEAQRTDAGLVFAGTSELGKVIFPNTLSFLGFSNEPYKPGMAYNTANQQCFLLSRKVALQLPYDEVIEKYGYEEMDFAYRVAASGAGIRCVASCVHLHLAPTSDGPIRPEQDACRLYVTYKRAAYVDRRRLKSLAFLGVALPHHILSCVRRYGPRGIKQAWANFRLAFRMLQHYRHQRAVTMQFSSPQR